MFSAFVLDPVHGWVATHRLPLDPAVRYCKEWRKKGFPVALAPDGEDPVPYLEAAEFAVKLEKYKRELNPPILRVSRFA